MNARFKPLDLRKTMTTYKRADGELIGDSAGWVTELDWFDDGLDEPLELIEERWIRSHVSQIWVFPPLYDCGIEDEDPCDEDAVEWWRSPDGVWLPLCEKHRG